VKTSAVCPDRPPPARRGPVRAGRRWRGDRYR